jgi:outer membrane protein assembly factor BamD (BamD/ComL family)
MGEDIMGKNISKNLLIICLVVFTAVLLVSVLEAAPLSKESQLFEKGYKQSTSNQHDKAVETFKSFLKEFPNSSSRDAAMFWLGKSLVQVKSLSEAKKVFSDIAKQFPESPFVPHLERELQALDTQSGPGKAETNAEVKTLVENAINAINELQLRLTAAENRASISETALAKAVAEKDNLQVQLDAEKNKFDAREAEVKNLTDNAARAILDFQLKLSQTDKKADISEPARLSP